jgi:hypothetical protein
MLPRILPLLARCLRAGASRPLLTSDASLCLDGRHSEAIDAHACNPGAPLSAATRDALPPEEMCPCSGRAVPSPTTSMALPAEGDAPFSRGHPPFRGTTPLLSRNGPRLCPRGRPPLLATTHGVTRQGPCPRPRRHVRLPRRPMHLVRDDTHPLSRRPTSSPRKATELPPNHGCRRPKRSRASPRRASLVARNDLDRFEKGCTWLLRKARGMDVDGCLAPSASRRRIPTRNLPPISDRATGACSCWSPLHVVRAREPAMR